MAGFDIKGLNATGITEYAMQESKNAATDALKNKLEQTNEKTSDDELWAACKGFESYFLEQIFKEMQKSVDSLKPEKSDNSTSTLVDYFKDQTLQDVCATSVDKQSNGFAQMLYENLKRNYDIPEAPAEEKTEQNTDGNSETSKL
jgi:Rod binding domain-containing protein